MSSIQTSVHKGHLNLQGTASSGEPQDAAALVKSLVGSGVVQEKTTQSVEFWQGNSMPDTGLAFNISGRATVIEANVGESLAGFDDPIKAVFNTQVCTDKSVIVKRKYVVGGKAVLTPERSAARSVSVKEDAVKVELSRYGGDVSMNTNLFLDAGLAKEELDMKMNAQKRELERRLVELGYAELMSRALRLPTAFVRSTIRGSKMNQQMRDRIQKRRAKAVYAKACFGAFGKYQFPLSNLLAAAKTATAYTGTTGPGDVMIVPHGTPEMLQHTVKSSVEYKINGLRTTDHAPISMSMDNVFDDPSSGIKIAIHRPMSSYSHGSAFPEAGRNCLEEVVSVWMYYPIPPKKEKIKVTNFEEGGYTYQALNLADGTAKAGEPGEGVSIDSVSDAVNQLSSAASMSNVGSLRTMIKNICESETIEEAIQKSAQICNEKSGKKEIKQEDLAKYYTKIAQLIAEKNIKMDAIEIGSEKAKNLNTACAKVLDGRKFSPAFAVLELMQKMSEDDDTFTTWMQLRKRQFNMSGNLIPAKEKDKKKLNNIVDIPARVRQPDASSSYFRPEMAAISDTEPSHYVRRVQFSMLNAVIAKSGSETGSLLVGYPMTSVSTNARTESMTVALRVYLGAILKRPENALVLPHVAFGGVVSDTGLMPARLYDSDGDQTASIDELAKGVPDKSDGDYCAKLAALEYARATKPAGATDATKFTTKTFKALTTSADVLKQETGERHFQLQKPKTGEPSASWKKLCAELMTPDLLLSCGGHSIGDGDWVENDGCLGHLDHPEYFEVVNGLQVYKEPVRLYRDVEQKKK